MIYQDDLPSHSTHQPVCVHAGNKAYRKDLSSHEIRHILFYSGLHNPVFMDLGPSTEYANLT